jgi:Na+/pantothenate symporter
LPVGVVGLLFAVIILASWGSISAALNSLAASSLIDIHLLDNKKDEKTELRLGRMHTLGWGVFCIGVAMFAAKMGSLIEAVNILGSLFYGTILGIFLVAFYIKSVNGKTVFLAAIITEVAVVAIYMFDIVSFLWLNVIGALLLMLLCYIIDIRKIISPSKSD